MRNPFVLEGPINTKSNVDGRDVVKTKTALSELGFFEPSQSRGGGEITPFTEQCLFEGLKAFQQANGLTPTGELKPGDKTARALRVALSSGAEQSSPKVESSVGAGGSNNAFDLGNVWDRLVASSHLKDSNAGFGAALTNAIRGFQADKGLKPDGLIAYSPTLPLITGKTTLSPT